MGGAARPLRRPLPRRPRRLDGRHGASQHPQRAPSLDHQPPVGGERLRTRLRRLPAPGRARGRPARAQARVRDRDRRVPARLPARRARDGRDGPDRDQVHQGHRGRLHRAGGALDHHDDVRGRAGAQQGARDLRGDGSERVLARARARRPPHDARLALVLLPAGADRCCDPRDRAAGDPVRSAARRGPQALRPRRSVHRHRDDAVARLHRDPGTAARVDVGAHRTARSVDGADRLALRRDRAPGAGAARAARHPALLDARRVPTSER